MVKDMRSILGLSQSIEGFTDGVERKAYPITMSKFPDFMEALSKISSKALWYNFSDEQSKKALECFLLLSFKDEQYEDLANQIHAGNWESIATAILKINGLYSPKEEQKESEGKQREE